MDKWNLLNGWEWKTLPEICEVNPPRPRIIRSDDAPTSFVPMQAVDDVEGRIVNMQTRLFGEVKRGYTYFEENDVLFAKITPSMENGKAAVARGLIGGFGFGTTEFHVFHPHKWISPDWIFYYIRRKSFRSEAKAQFRGAVGQQRVPEDFLSAYSIPIPYPDDPARSLETQRHIVTRLEALLAEVAEARKMSDDLASNTNIFRKSALAYIFGQADENNWSMHRLGDLVDNYDGRRIPVREADRKNQKKIYPYYGASGEIDKVENYLFDGEFLLVSEDGANLVARTYPIAFLARGKFWVNNHAHVLQAKDETSNLFLAYAIEATDISRYVTGAAQPKLSQTRMNDIPIWLPNNPGSQELVIQYLRSVDDEITELKVGQMEMASMLDLLEQSLLVVALRGEL